MDIPTMVRSFSINIPADAARIYNLSGSSVALFLSLQGEPFVAVEQTEEAALRLYGDIVFFRKIIKSPDDALPFISFLPDPNGPESSGRRAEVIAGMKSRESLVTSAQGVQAPVWSKDDLEKDSIIFTRGRGIERDSLGERLEQLGYKRVSIVAEKGEFCLKRWLLDIFPSTSEDPIRIEFFGDEIEAIKPFEIETQKSTGRMETLILLPAIEPSHGNGVGTLFPGRQFLIDPPGEQANKADEGVLLSRFAFGGEGFDGGLLSLRGHGIFPDERRTLADLSYALRLLAGENRVMVVSSSPGQAERVREILREGDLIAPLLEAGEVARYEGTVSVTTGGLSSGFFLPGLAVLTEKEIFGERPLYRPLRRSRVSGLLASMDDIAPGDFVVHRDHGIGRFVSIQRQASEGREGELIVLEYTGGDRLYIPLYNINKIKKYNAEEGVLPHLDRLGGRTWQRTKERVKKAIREMAERLLKLYAEREIARGFVFSADTELHREFYGFFPYEETPDQIKAIEEIGRDMESEKPMERLLCGDVGYGKTEVAMRAAFKAVFDGRQVAVLVPTTILCEQHYLTFTSRFSAFPVHIDY
ncbi:MAG TPA: CarD family transcriptional regulator, partial [Thermodesulfovibrionales bacterium]|nr:CarD family transcriptional regulator [Thermodesulfovibrionales bacterium]